MHLQVKRFWRGLTTAIASIYAFYRTRILRYFRLVMEPSKSPPATASHSIPSGSSIWILQPRSITHHKRFTSILKNIQQCLPQTGVISPAYNKTPVASSYGSILLPYLRSQCAKNRFKFLNSLMAFLWSALPLPGVKRVENIPSKRSLTNNLASTMSDAPPSTVQKEQILRDSSAFKAGYGDFALISSDGVRFHIDRSLLAHVSGFFKDLFGLPGAQPSALANHETSLLLKETAAIVESFLSHIDPNKTSPEINTSTIAALLEVARFYRVPMIIAWFENEVVIRRIRFRSNGKEPCFMEQHPLLVLVLAYHFGLTDLTQLAMSELITCEAELWKEDVDAVIDGRLILYCRALRDERTLRFSGLVHSLTQHELSKAKNIKDHTCETCMSCTVARAEWTHNMMEIAIRRPEWAAFKASYNKEVDTYSCSCDDGISWPDHKRNILQKWINVNQPERIEGKLPSTPEWMSRQLRENDLLTD